MTNDYHPLCNTSSFFSRFKYKIWRINFLLVIYYIEQACFKLLSQICLFKLHFMWGENDLFAYKYLYKGWYFLEFKNVLINKLAYKNTSFSSTLFQQFLCFQCLWNLSLHPQIHCKTINYKSLQMANDLWKKKNNVFIIIRFCCVVN